MIRLAKHADILNLVELMGEFCAEAKYPERYGVPFDPPSAAKWVFHQMKNPGAVVLLSTEEDDKAINGFLVGVLVPWILNFNEKIAIEILFYVRKGRRNGFISKSLINLFEKTAMSAGAKVIEVGSALAMDGKRVSKLFDRMGFEHYQNGHLKRLEAANGRS